MQTHQHHPHHLIWSRLFSHWQRQTPRRRIGVLVALLIVSMLGSMALLTIQGRIQPFALAAALFSGQPGGSCQAGDTRYVVQGGNTLSTIATHYKMDWTLLAKYNHLSNPRLISPHQVLCIPGTRGKGQPGPTANLYLVGQCTWWANERYHQVHGVYVPWTTNADAWQWVDRAQEFGWHVSKTPRKGDIIVLQKNVQGAGDLGHVAVVERVLPDGSVLTSNMNWGTTPQQKQSKVNVKFVPGPGVSFIHQ